MNKPYRILFRIIGADKWLTIPALDAGKAEALGRYKANKNARYGWVFVRVEGE